MADATIAVTPGRIASLQDLAAVYITVTGSTTQYTSASGGFPFDLFDTLTKASPFWGRRNYQDIIGFVPLGLTSTGYRLDSFTVGTATTTTLPCTIRMYGIGENAQDPLMEIANNTMSPVFSGLLLFACNGAN